MPARWSSSVESMGVVERVGVEGLALAKGENAEDCPSPDREKVRTALLGAVHSLLNDRDISSSGEPRANH